MSGGNSTAAMQAIQSLLRLVLDIRRLSTTGFTGRFKKDCTDLSRRIALLSNFVEEIRDFHADRGPFYLACSSSAFRCSISELTTSLTSAKILLQSAGCFDHNTFPKIAAVEFTSQFRSIVCKLEIALANFPYGDFELSEEVKEQVDLVRGQLKRATERYGVKSEIGDLTNENLPLKTSDAVEEEMKMNEHDSPVIPFDFICPISRELFRDPVIVSTGQTYERSYIERWINGGNETCPKTRKKLETLRLTPNCVLRSLIGEWCKEHDVEQPTLPLPTKKITEIVTEPSIECFSAFDVLLIFVLSLPLFFAQFYILHVL